jgi:hypothetical protein
MKKTVSITDCKRPIELPINRYNKHQDEVDHWCNGGKIEMEYDGCGWLVNSNPEFCIGHNYRIVKHAPKSGEVWIIVSNSIPCLMTGLGDEFPLVSLDGSNRFALSEYGIEFASVSVEAYYDSISCLKNNK